MVRVSVEKKYSSTDQTQILNKYMLSYRYVLLKERNMLMTLKHEAKRQSFPMPSPTRTHKVKDEELVYCGSNYEQ